MDAAKTSITPITTSEPSGRGSNPKVTKDSRMQLTFDYRNIYRQQMMAAVGDESGDVTPPGDFYKLKVTGIMDQDNNDFSYYCIMEASQLEKLAKANKDFINFEAGKYQTVLVKCADIESVKPVKTAITEMGYGTATACRMRLRWRKRAHRTCSTCSAPSAASRCSSPPSA
ncbi:MAG: hypothetical protein R2912_06065 [Eubacteriales bacterium]